MEKKYNKEHLFTGKQVIFFSIITILFFVLIVGITVKFGLEGSKDKQEKEELLQQQQEEAKYYNIIVDEELFDNGFITYNKEVYYRLYDTTIIDENMLGEFLIKCNDENLILTDGVYEYRVKDGFKNLNAAGGDVYSLKNNEDIIVLTHYYDGTNWDEADVYLYIKKDAYKEYEMKNIKELYKNNFDGIQLIHFKSKQASVPNFVIGEVEINKFLKTADNFEYNFLDDNLIIAAPDYYDYTMLIEFDNGILYEYEALYKVANKTLYMQEYLDEKTGICYGVASVVDFIKEAEY